MIDSQYSFLLSWVKTNRDVTNHTVPYGTKALRAYSPHRPFAYTVFLCKTDFANIILPSSSVCGR